MSVLFHIQSYVFCPTLKWYISWFSLPLLCHRCDCRAHRLQILPSSHESAVSAEKQNSKIATRSTTGKHNVFTLHIIAYHEPLTDTKIEAETFNDILHVALLLYTSLWNFKSIFADTCQKVNISLFYVEILNVLYSFAISICPKVLKCTSKWHNIVNNVKS